MPSYELGPAQGFQLAIRPFLVRCKKDPGEKLQNVDVSSANSRPSLKFDYKNLAVKYTFLKATAALSRNGEYQGRQCDGSSQTARLLPFKERTKNYGPHFRDLGDF